MIRTTDETKITFVNVEIENDEIIHSIGTYSIREKDKEKAVKAFRKIEAYESAAIVMIECDKEVYIMDDEYFFTFAHKCTPEEKTKYLKQLTNI